MKDPVAVERVDIDYERLKSLTKLIQLHNIVVAEASLRSAVDPRSFGDAAGQKSYALSLGEARWWLDGSALDILLEYRVTALLSRESEQTEIFRVTARFVVSYTITDESSVPTDDRNSLMSDFVAANGQINVFPYLRQLVADLTSRAGWSPLLLNVFKAPVSRPRTLVRMARAWDAGPPVIRAV